MSDERRRLGLSGHALDAIKRHQDEDRGAWHDYDEDDFARKLDRAIVDRDILIAEIDRLLVIIADLERRGGGA